MISLRRRVDVRHREEHELRCGESCPMCPLNPQRSTATSARWVQHRARGEDLVCGSAASWQTVNLLALSLQWFESTPTHTSLQSATRLKRGRSMPFGVRRSRTKEGWIQAQPWLPYLASSGATDGKPYFASERGLSETWACPPKPWRRWAKYARRLVRPSF